MFKINAVKRKERQPVMTFLPYMEILNFGEFCLFTYQDLDMAFFYMGGGGGGGAVTDFL